MSEISCEEVLHEIEHFIDGELDPRQSSHLADHLAACGSCLGHADFQRKLKEIVRSKCAREDEAAPQHLLEKVRLRIKLERGPEA